MFPAAIPSAFEKNEILVFMGGLFIASCWLLHLPGEFSINFSFTIQFLFFWLFSIILLYVTYIVIALIVTIPSTFFINKLFKNEKIKQQLHLSFLDSRFISSKVFEGINNASHLFTIIILSCILAWHPLHELLAYRLKYISWDIFEIFFVIGLIILGLSSIVMLIVLSFMNKAREYGIVIIFDEKKYREEMGIEYSKKILAKSNAQIPQDK